MKIEELEAWFRNTKLPEGPISLYPGTTILNIPLFLESHFATIKNKPGSKNSQPSFDRLVALKEILEKKQLS